MSSLAVEQDRSSLGICLVRIWSEAAPELLIPSPHARSCSHRIVQASASVGFSWLYLRILETLSWAAVPIAQFA